MTKEQRSILRYYDEIFIEDSLNKRVEDYCNKKHLYRLYRDKPVVMKEIKTSLKEFAEQETEPISKQLIKAKELLKWALHSDPEHDEDFEQKWEEAEQFLSEVEK